MLGMQNNYIHHWIDWREYLFLLNTTGIYCRYSWSDYKTGIIEALAYGNIVVLTREHSNLIYDPGDVVLIPHTLDDLQTNPEQIKMVVEGKLRGILTDPYYADWSEAVEKKYSQRHSLGSVMSALEVIPWLS